ncbi:fibronectin type III domain-containing protein, partial [Patescibacteria group bacterium]|nr:fibronectin type III domain-containing protein [Patescibacteria group bacterium]
MKKHSHKTNAVTQKKDLSSLLQKKKFIFTVSGLFILILLSVIILFRSKLQPLDVNITSHSSGTFTVNWRTSMKSGGTVYVSEKNSFLPIIGKFGKEKFIDERDTLNGKSKAYYNHSIVVTGLDPEKEYYFRVGSTAFLYSSDNKNTDFKTSTPKVSENFQTPVPLWGSVLDSQNNPISDSIVTLQLTNTDGQKSNEISTVTSFEGTWTLDSTGFYTKDLNEEFDLKKSPDVKMVISTMDGADYQVDRIIDQLAPSGPMILGEDLIRVSYKNDLKQLIDGVFAKSGTINGAPCDAVSCRTQGTNQDTSCCDVIACAKTDCVDNIQGASASIVSGHWEANFNDAVWQCWGGIYNKPDIQNCINTWGQGGEPAQPQPPAGGCERKEIPVKVEAWDNTYSNKVNFNSQIQVFFGINSPVYDGVNKQYIITKIKHSDNPGDPNNPGINWEGVRQKGGWLGVSAIAQSGNFATDNDKGNVMINICDVGADGVVLKLKQKSATSPQPPTTPSTPAPEPPVEVPAAPEECKSEIGFGYQDYNYPGGSGALSKCTEQGGTCMTPFQFDQEGLTSKGWTSENGWCPGKEPTAEGQTCEWRCRIPAKVEYGISDSSGNTIDIVSWDENDFNPDKIKVTLDNGMISSYKCNFLDGSYVEHTTSTTVDVDLSKFPDTWLPWADDKDGTNLSQEGPAKNKTKFLNIGDCYYPSGYGENVGHTLLFLKVKNTGTGGGSVGERSIELVDIEVSDDGGTTWESERNDNTVIYVDSNNKTMFDTSFRFTINYKKQNDDDIMGCYINYDPTDPNNTTIYTTSESSTFPDIIKLDKGTKANGFFGSCVICDYDGAIDTYVESERIGVTQEVYTPSSSGGPKIELVNLVASSNYSFSGGLTEIDKKLGEGKILLGKI